MLSGPGVPQFQITSVVARFVRYECQPEVKHPHQNGYQQTCSQSVGLPGKPSYRMGEGVCHTCQYDSIHCALHIRPATRLNIISVGFMIFMFLWFISHSLSQKDTTAAIF